MIFKINMNGFKAFRRKIILTAIPAYFIGVLFVVFISGTELELLAFMLFSVSGAVAFAILNQIKKQKKVWESFEVEITDSSVILRRYNHDDISIGKDEITRIHRVPTGYFVIHGADKFNPIIIPGKVLNDEEFERQISHLGEIRTAKISKGIATMLLYILPILVSLVLFYASNNKHIITLSGVLLVLTIIYGGYVSLKSRVYSKKMKLTSLLAIIIIAAIIYRLFVLWI